MAIARAEGMRWQISCRVWCVSDVVGVVGYVTCSFTELCWSYEVHYNLLRFSQIIVWYGVIMLCMVSYGTLWCDMVWYDVIVFDDCKKYGVKGKSPQIVPGGVHWREIPHYCWTLLLQLNEWMNGMGWMNCRMNGWLNELNWTALHCTALHWTEWMNE